MVSEDPEKLANQEDTIIRLRLTLNFWKPGKLGGPRNVDSQPLGPHYYNIWNR